MVSLVDARFTNTDFLTEFIELYKVNTCLWQVKSTDYSNRDKRASAYQSLVDLCKKVNSKCDVNFVKKKIANLRNAFRKEHSKVKSCKKLGAGASEIYVPKLWYYKLLEFTADHEEPRESFCSIDDAAQDTQPTEDDDQISEPAVEDKDDQAEKQSSSTLSSTPSNPSIRRAQKRKAYKLDNLVETAMSVLKKPNDECDIFARHVSTELRSMNDTQRALAKQKMSQIIFKGRMNQLSQCSSTLGTNSQDQQELPVQELAEAVLQPDTSEQVKEDYHETYALKKSQSMTGLQEHQVPGHKEYFPCNDHPNSTDEDLLFLKSLLPDMKMLSVRRKRKYKQILLTTLHTFLDEQETELGS